jgi:hypothetical protein
MKLPKDKALYVEGGFRVWLREAQVSVIPNLIKLLGAFLGA